MSRADEIKARQKVRWRNYGSRVLLHAETNANG